MEKRLLLAFALSFLVLTIWTKMTVNPSKSLQHVDSQYVSNKSDINIASATKVDSVEIVEKKSDTKSIINFPQKLSKIQNDKLSLEFSNQGGDLKRITINHLDADIPIKELLGLNNYDDKEFRMDRMDNKEIVYSFNDNGLRIIKSYKLNENDYIVQSKITFKNETPSILNLDDSTTLYQINFKEELANKEEWAKTHGHDQSLFEYVIYSQSGISRKNNAFKFNSKEDRQVNENIDWVAFRTRYTCAIIKPNFSTEKLHIQKEDENVLNLKIFDKPTQINPGQEISNEYTMYFGPEDTKTLKSYGADFEKIKRFYRLALFDAPAKIIYWLLHFIHKFISNWGVCIMIIATIIYGVTYPLTLKSMSSMKRMQELSPKMAALKEKHKDNPQKLNKEMMLMYKEQKINPLAGCIPVLFQMPVFIGLYQVLWRDPSFKGASFLWMKDLTLPDRLISKLPLIGIDLNILPLIMCVIMFFQQKLTAKNMTYADPDQEAQQKMMAKIMPIMMAFIFYSFASGINLYFTLFYTYSALTQLKMSKMKNV